MNTVAALLTFFGCLLFSGAVLAQDPPPNLATDQLVGSIKTVEHGRIGYTFRDGKTVESNRTVFQKTSYDQDGNRTEKITYREGGAISERLVYTYDVLKRNTGYEEYFSLTGQTLLGPRKHIYTLDANGHIVEFMLYESDGSIGSRFTYSHDARGNKTEECFYSWNGSRTGRLVHSYDEQGHVLSLTSYNNDDTAAWKNVNAYDPNGHQIEWVQYQNGVLRYKRISKYDDKGRLSEQETFEFNSPPNVFSDHAPVPGKVVYTYGERSKEIANYDTTGSVTRRELSKLDEKGNEVGREFFNGKGSRELTEVGFVEDNKIVARLGGTSQTKIEYDSHGNWIRKTYLIMPVGAKEGVPSSAEYRIITYYEDK
jgi:antitoxin component YwqK of YwqJK toxin-antitoxin module